MSTATETMVDDDPFAITTDTSGMDQENIHDGGNFVSAEGRFHVLVESVELISYEAGKTLPYVKMQMRVLAGEVDTETQKTLTHRIYIKDWADKPNREGMKPISEGRQKQILAFLYGFGVIGEDAFGQEAYTISRNDWERLEFAQAIVKIRLGKDRKGKDKEGNERTYKGKYEIGFNSDVWSLGHESVKDVPVDIAAAESAGIDMSGESADVDLDDI